MDIGSLFFEKEFAKLNDDNILIKHVPLTPRYILAAQIAKTELKTSGKVIGWLEIQSIWDRSFEVVFFSNPAFDRKCGYYFGTRFHFKDAILQTVTIFCFYNGLDKSPCFQNVDQAIQWMHEIEKKNQIKYQNEVCNET